MIDAILEVVVYLDQLQVWTEHCKYSFCESVKFWIKWTKRDENSLGPAHDHDDGKYDINCDTRGCPAQSINYRLCWQEELKMRQPLENSKGEEKAAQSEAQFAWEPSLATSQKLRPEEPQQLRPANLGCSTKVHPCWLGKHQKLWKMEHRHETKGRQRV